MRGDGAAAAPALSARAADPDGREHGRGGADVPGDGAPPPPVDGYVLVAPAVWGRAEMNVFLRASLWLAANLIPGLTVTGACRAGGRERQPGGDQAAVAGSADHPRDAVRHGPRPGGPDGRGLAAAPRFRAPALFLYGGKDELIPDRRRRRPGAGCRGAGAGILSGGLPPAAARPRADDADRRHPVLDAPSGRAAAVRRQIGRQGRGWRSRSDGEALIRPGFALWGAETDP